MYWQVSKFEVLSWRAGRGSPRWVVTLSVPDLLNQVTTDGGPFFLAVMATCQQHPDVGLGLVELWLNTDGMAWVSTVDPSIGNYSLRASDPSRAGLTGEVGGFFDDKAGPFAVPAAEVITLRQAADVLSHWLDCGGRFPGLTWT